MVPENVAIPIAPPGEDEGIGGPILRRAFDIEGAGAYSCRSWKDKSLEGNE